ncbi:MAG: indolepyruvate oxidoreductase subunit beta family protein, partial [Gammaproteobacteria bacterium]|nr:indolepyruvate oxidoreductase subunit beta family protein [Gammaproteobacteria bacterium]
MSRPRRLSIAIAALGGQGGGVLADWLVETAESQDWWAQSTSVPGVAQRTGTTIYYVEICERSAADGARPVLALMPTPGDVNLVIAAEWVEAGRAMLRGLVTPQRTTLVASSHRIYSIAEKSVPGDGIVDAGAVLAAARAEAHRLVMFDMEAVAAAQGTVVSAVLLGAAAASGALPFPRAAYEQAIHRAGIAVAGSLRGFAAGFERASTAPASATDGTAATKDATGAPADAVGLPGDLDRRIETALPAEARALARAGVRRLIDYQDKAYASFYLDRLEKIAALERALPVSAHERAGHESPSAAVARYLALWMSYEDVIRVADLKTRAARFDRVRREARAAASELVEVEEYMHPRVEEICDTLPAWLGRRVLATGWMRRVLERFTRHGRRV